MGIDVESTIVLEIDIEKLDQKFKGAKAIFELMEELRTNKETDDEKDPYYLPMEMDGLFSYDPLDYPESDINDPKYCGRVANTLYKKWQILNDKMLEHYGYGLNYSLFGNYYADDEDEFESSVNLSIQVPANEWIMDHIGILTELRNDLGLTIKSYTSIM